MSYKKEDFILMENAGGGESLVNISKIKFVVEVDGGTCRVYFGSGDDDYILIKTTIDDFTELL
jgi:hypothetical protein